MENLETIEESIYSLMKKMKVDEKMVVPISEWKHARSYANHMKDKYKMLFLVSKMGTRKTRCDHILITRTK